MNKPMVVSDIEPKLCNKESPKTKKVCGAIPEVLHRLKNRALFPDDSDAYYWRICCPKCGDTTNWMDKDDTKSPSSGRARAIISWNNGERKKEVIF